MMRSALRWMEDHAELLVMAICALLAPVVMYIVLSMNKESQKFSERLQKAGCVAVGAGEDVSLYPMAMGNGVFLAPSSREHITWTCPGGLTFTVRM